MEEQIKNEKLVSTDWLEENLNQPEIQIVEVSDMKNPEAYFAGHIPGAVYWPWKETLWHPTMREFVTAEDFARLMQENGISHETAIILYSNSSQFAHYAFWVCQMRGNDNVKILHGNRTLWVKEGRPMSQEMPKITRATYSVKPADESSRIGWQGVLAGLDSSDRVLLDLRSPEEFMGERVFPKWFEFDHGAERKGHIPGAKHLFYTELLNEDETFKPENKLREAFYKRGATPDKDIVCHCRLSHRGSMGWFIARYVLGYPRVRVYDGSWTEWGSMVGLPIVNESIK